MDIHRHKLCSLAIFTVFLVSTVSQQLICTDSSIDLVFVVDGSGSICDPFARDTTGLKGCSNWNLATNFISEFVRRLDVSNTGSHVGIVTFSNEAKTLVNLNDYTDSESLVNWVTTNFFYPDGTTATAAGLLQALNNVLVEENGDRNNANNVVVLITDGIPTVPAPEENARTSAIEAAAQLKSKAKIFSIGVTSLVDIAFLRDVSTGGVENIDFFQSPTFGDLEKIRDQVIYQTCVTPTPEPNCQDTVIDLVFVVDASGSICDPDPFDTTGLRGCSNWDLVANFIADFVKTLQISSTGNRVGIILFSDDARTAVYLDQYTDSISLANWITTRLYYIGGDTATSDGLLQALNDVLSGRGERTGVPNVVVVITDGIPTIPAPDDNARVQALDSARRLKAVAKIFSVGVTNLVDSEFLRDISTGGNSGQDYFETPSFEALEKIRNQVISQTCEVATSPQTKTPTTLSTRTAPQLSTASTTPELSCRDTIIDLVFIIDGSGSICDPELRDTMGLRGCTNWDHVVNFISQFVEYLDISISGNHVGIVTFSDYADTRMYLDQFSDSVSLVNWIRANLYYMDGDTATAAGITQAINDVFSDLRGDRSSVKNVAIIITDGIPTIPPPESNARAEAMEAAARLKDIAKVFSIGVTDSIDVDFLKDLSTGGVQGYDYFQSPTFSGLTTILSQVISQTCEVVTRTSSTTKLTPTVTSVSPEPTLPSDFTMRLQPKALFVDKGCPERLMCTVFNAAYNVNIKFSWYNNYGQRLAMESENSLIETMYFYIPSGTSYWQSSLYIAPSYYKFSGNYTCEVNYNSRVMAKSSYVLIHGCPPGEFMCNCNKVCIPCSKVCDQRNDCADYSDEFGCDYGRNPASNDPNCNVLLS